MTMVVQIPVITESLYRLVVAGGFSWMRWKTISVLVPLIRVSKRLMTGWMSN
jgi:hypothetical protein